MAYIAVLCQSVHISSVEMEEPERQSIRLCFLTKLMFLFTYTHINHDYTLNLKSNMI